MKRNYVTPAIAVEYYNLTQSIAVCDRKIGLTDSLCVINDYEDATDDMREWAYDKWFLAGCEKYAEEMGANDGMCYHTNANAAFAS